MIKFWRDENSLRVVLIGIFILITYLFILVPLEVFSRPRLKAADIATYLKHTFKILPKNIQDIVIVAVDDQSFREMGKKWPWERKVFADLINKLETYQPRLISFDVIFVGASNESDDNILAEAIEGSSHILLASYFDESGKHILPDEAFLQVGANSGFINKPQDKDFRVRNAWAVLFSPQYEAKDYSFEIKLAAQYFDVPFDQISFEEGEISVADLLIPVRKDGTMAINYAADYNDFTVIPFWKVIQSEGSSEVFRDKIVLVGATTEAIHDIYLTPFGSMPGVGICANNLLMLLSGNFLKEFPKAASFLILLIFVLLIAPFSYSLPYWRNIIFSAFSILLFLLLYFALFFFYNYNADYFGVIFLGSCIFVAASIFKYLKTSLSNASLRKLVVTDISTGLYIYRYFRFKLQAEVLQAIKTNSKISLMIVGIDNFQQISDDYGVEQSNLVLRTVAQVLRDNTPAGSLLARYAEDRLAVIFKLNHQKVISAARKIKEEIENFDFSSQDEPFKIFFSIGLASHPQAQINSSRDLIRCTEAALNRAKGQSEVCIFDSRLDKVHLGMREKKPGARSELEYIASDYLEDKYRELNDTLEELRQSHKDMERAFFEFIRSLIKALEAKDTYTAGHSDRVCKYATMLAEALEVPEDELGLIAQAALLHDIGKIGLPEHILCKESRLSDEELEVVKQHPAEGVRILEPIEFFKKYIPLVLHHHEKYDGTGYPHGLSREFIPLGAHIIAIADAFDAMTTGRTYIKPLTVDEAIAELKKNSGSQFKPEFVEKFIQVLKANEIQDSQRFKKD